MISHCNDTNRNNGVIEWSVANITCIIQSLQQEQVLVGISDTVFGLMAVPSLAGFNALNAIKGRGKKPYLLLVGSIEHALSYVDSSNKDQIRALMQACWPGPVTLILPAKDSVPGYMKSVQGTVALRCPKHEGLQMLLKKIPALFSTSANLAGGPIPHKAQEIDPTIRAACPYIVLDAQEKMGLVLPSTIIDCAAVPYKIVREGAFSQVDLDALMQKVMQK